MSKSIEHCLNSVTSNLFMIKFMTLSKKDTENCFKKAITNLNWIDMNLTNRDPSKYFVEKYSTLVKEWITNTNLITGKLNLGINGLCLERHAGGIEYLYYNMRIHRLIHSIFIKMCNGYLNEKYTTIEDLANNFFVEINNTIYPRVYLAKIEDAPKNTYVAFKDLLATIFDVKTLTYVSRAYVLFIQELIYFDNYIDGKNKRSSFIRRKSKLHYRRCQQRSIRAGYRSRYIYT